MVTTDVQPGQERIASLEGAPAGQGDRFTVRVVSGLNVIYLDDAPATEIEPGTYIRTYTAPATQGAYLEIWTDTAGTVDLEPETINVTSTRVFTTYTPSSAFYATPADVRNMYPELKNRSDAELQDALDKAERDIDDYAGFVPVLDNGRKFDLDPVTGGLAQSDVNAIIRATCAQARFRLYMGPAYFIEEVGYAEVGGDVPVKKPPRYGPEMRMEFPSTLRKLTGALS